jgi:hypothetical protein
MTGLRALAFASLCLLAPAADARELIFGLAREDFQNRRGYRALALDLELHSVPLWRVGGFDIAGAGAIIADDEGDIWIGIGPAVIRRFASRYFFEASLMTGYYDQSPGGIELGSGLEFRTLGGIGMRLPNGADLSIAMDHKSNRDTGSFNPGVEKLSLRYRFGF